MSEMQGGGENVSADKMQVTQYGWHDIYERFHPLVAPFKWKIIVSMICVALAGIAVALMPLFPKYVIDTAIPAKNMTLAVVAAVIFVIVQFSRMGLWYIAMRGIYRVQQSVVFKLRARSFGHLQHLCLSFHFGKLVAVRLIAYRLRREERLCHAAANHALDIAGSWL